jgi:hypothetical protein
MIFGQNRPPRRQQWLICGNFVLRERTTFRSFPSLYSDRLLAWAIRASNIGGRIFSPDRSDVSLPGAATFVAGCQSATERLP